MADKNQAAGTFSVIGNNTVITGNFRTEGSIRVDGKIVGNVITQADAAPQLSPGNDARAAARAASASKGNSGNSGQYSISMQSTGQMRSHRVQE